MLETLVVRFGFYVGGCAVGWLFLNYCGYFVGMIRSGIHIPYILSQRYAIHPQRHNCSSRIAMAAEIENCVEFAAALKNLLQR